MGRWRLMIQKSRVRTSMLINISKNQSYVCVGKKIVKRFGKRVKINKNAHIGFHFRDYYLEHVLCAWVHVLCV